MIKVSVVFGIQVKVASGLGKHTTLTALGMVCSHIAASHTPALKHKGTKSRSPFEVLSALRALCSTAHTLLPYAERLLASRLPPREQTVDVSPAKRVRVQSAHSDILYEKKASIALSIVPG
jgi:hypothetical protein